MELGSGGSGAPAIFPPLAHPHVTTAPQLIARLRPIGGGTRKIDLEMGRGKERCGWWAGAQGGCRMQPDQIL